MGAWYPAFPLLMWYCGSGLPPLLARGKSGPGPDGLYRRRYGGRPDPVQVVAIGHGPAGVIHMPPWNIWGAHLFFSVGSRAPKSAMDAGLRRKRGPWNISAACG